MPRVYLKTKSNRGKTYNCVAPDCAVATNRDGSRAILPGDHFYQWSRRFGRSGQTYYQHTDCGRPKRSQLSSRKTVAIEDAIEDAEKAIEAWVPELEEGEEGGHPTFAYDGGYEDVTTALEAVAEVARDVGQEYQDSYDAMPEGLNQGSTGEALQEVAQELESYADTVDDFSPNNDEPDLPGYEDDPDFATDAEAYREACETALSDWAGEVRSDASDAMADMPEYQG